MYNREVKWMLFGICSLLVVAGLIVWVVWPGKSALSPKEKTLALREILGRNPNLNNPATVTWLTHKRASLQFVYPSNATIYTADNQKAVKQPGTLDSFSFNVPDDHVYAVVQAVVFSGNLPDYPAVNVRLSQSNIYTPSGTSSGAMQFSKDIDMVERSAFFLKNGKVVSIAVTGYSDEKVGSLFSSIISSLKIF